MTEAYINDKRINRDSKVTDDERGILNVLSQQLGLTTDECAAIEHLVDAIPKDGVLDALNTLRDMGIVFISKKRQEVFIPDEIERKSEPVSYNDLVEGQDVPKNKNSSPLLGKIKSVISSLTKAA